MESYSSASSESPSGTLTSSSSSFDDLPRYSQAVLQKTIQCPEVARKSILVDLSHLDREYNQVMGRRMLEVGFTHDGVYYPADEVLFEDGALPVLSIDRQGPLAEEALFTHWVDVMLGRIRGLLNDGRVEAQAVLELDIDRWRVI